MAQPVTKLLDIKNKNSGEEGRGYCVKQKAIFIKTLLSCERRDSYSGSYTYSYSGSYTYFYNGSYTYYYSGSYTDS
jgi:hypothetical protein